MEPVKTYLENRYKEFWKKNYKVFTVPDFTEIGIELGDFLCEERGGLVFVGVNPSGANQEYYEDYFQKDENKDKQIKVNPQNAVIWYSPDETHRKRDGFLRATEKFVGDCGYEHYSKLDVFCVVRKKQDDVKSHFGANKEVYREMFDIFADVIKRIEPKVIVVANAFVRELFIGEMFDDIIHCTKNNEYGGYCVNVKGAFKTQVYFSSMLSGVRALDVGSRENLVWLIKNYTKNHH